MGSRYAREDKKKGIFGYKRFLFPLIKLVCSSSMSSSVPHKIAALKEAVPVPKRVSVIQCDVTESVILSDRYRGVTVRS